MPEVSNRDWQAWVARGREIASLTQPPKLAERDQEKRIALLTKKGNEEAFINYYFPHYVRSPLGWFHHKALRSILDNPDSYTILEWPREHAKSVLADVFIPIILNVRQELTGMILVGETEKKGIKLLSDLQNEFQNNQRLIQDFGYQVQEGTWADGCFANTQGFMFWGFGLGQNPSGSRNGANRPNYGVADDCDSLKTAKNQELTRERYSWLHGELMGCFDTKGSRFVYANNRVARNGLTAHVVGDVEEGMPKHPGREHIKVFFTEDPKTHKRKLPEDPGAAPAWKENYTMQHVLAKRAKMSSIQFLRQMYHEHIIEGSLFKHEWIKWCEPLKPHRYDQIVSYCDPSFKDTKTADFKAIITIGRSGREFHVIDVFCRQCSIEAMVQYHFDLWLKYKDLAASHWIEANYVQDVFFQSAYDAKGDELGMVMPIIPDKRPKIDKVERITLMTTFFERGLVWFSNRIKGDSDTKNLLDQFMSFPNGLHDDGPDAFEGAMSKINVRAGSHRDSDILFGNQPDSGRRLI